MTRLLVRVQDHYYFNSHKYYLFLNAIIKIYLLLILGATRLVSIFGLLTVSVLFTKLLVAEPLLLAREFETLDLFAMFLFVAILFGKDILGLGLCFGTILHAFSFGFVALDKARGNATGGTLLQTFDALRFARLFAGWQGLFALDQNGI